MNATHISRNRLTNKSVLLARAMRSYCAWWFTQMIPIVKKDTTYAANDGHSSPRSCHRQIFCCLHSEQCAPFRLTSRSTGCARTIFAFLDGGPN